MKNKVLRGALPLSLGLALTLALSGCKDDESIPPIAAGTEYFPIEAGTFRIYQVTDSSYYRYVLRDSTYQVRESIATSDAFTDATGHTSYRVVRAHRRTPADAWVNDSVLVLTPTAQTVTLAQDNRRTVELIFPVREGRSWNINAYNNNTDDTITAETRRYSRVGQPITLGQGANARTYEQTATVTTLDDNKQYFENAFFLRQYRQVFAKGLGPVLRRYRHFVYAEDGNVPDGRIFRGTIRHEALVEYGRY